MLEKQGGLGVPRFGMRNAANSPKTSGATIPRSIVSRSRVIAPEYTQVFGGTPALGPIVTVKPSPPNSNPGPPAQVSKRPGPQPATRVARRSAPKILRVRGRTSFIAFLPPPPSAGPRYAKDLW